MDKPRLMDDKFRSRKWLLSCFIQGSATIALMMGKLTGADFAAISSATIASYSFANAVEYWKSS